MRAEILWQALKFSTRLFFEQNNWIGKGKGEEKKQSTLPMQKKKF